MAGRKKNIYLAVSVLFIGLLVMVIFLKLL